MVTPQEHTLVIIVKIIYDAHPNGIEEEELLNKNIA